MHRHLKQPAVAYRFFGVGGEQKLYRIKQQSEISVSDYSYGTTGGFSGKSEIFSKSEFPESEKMVGYCICVLKIFAQFFLLLFFMFVNLVLEDEFFWLRNTQESSCEHNTVRHPNCCFCSTGCVVLASNTEKKVKLSRLISKNLSACILLHMLSCELCFLHDCHLWCNFCFVSVFCNVSRNSAYVKTISWLG